MSKTRDQILLSTEEIIHNCITKGDTESLNTGYTMGCLAELSKVKFSPKMMDDFSIICFRLGDYYRTFDYSSNALKSNVSWSEMDCDRLRGNMSMAIELSKDELINRFSEYDSERVGYLFSSIWRNRKKLPMNKKLTVTMTMCKRYDLFRKTVSSFINCCEDLDLIDDWIVIDDNSSDSDREKAIMEFPFIRFVWKNISDKGHARSMNILRKMVQTPFIFHMEDDWLFYRKERYLSLCLKIIDENPLYGQCLLNRSYGEREKCYDISCPSPMKFTHDNDRYYEHTFLAGKELEKFSSKKHCVYWPHYSLRVGITRKEIFDKVGEFNETADHFEMEYAYRYSEKGYKTVFMDSLYCYHTGRCTFERGSEIKNAYDLNDESQFVKKTPLNPETNKSRLLTLTEEEKKIPLYTNQKLSHQKDVTYRTKTYVMNMERRPDRLQQFVIDNHESLEALQYSFFKGIDGQLVKPLPKTLKLFETGDYNYRKGIVGCASSHIKIWNELIISELDVMIVLEDDVTLTSNFVEKLISALKSLPPNEWDILFLGHFLYPHLRKKEDRSDKTPTVEKWSKDRCCRDSMGGTIGYAIHKRGAMSMYKHIQENGIYNAIDWVMFKNESAKIFYCYPHIVFSECATNTITPDSDIQYDKSSLCISDEQRLDLELEYWKNKGINPIVTNDTPSRDKLLCNVYFLKTDDYLKLIYSLQHLPIEFYTLKGKYVVCIPHTKLGKEINDDIIIDGGYINVNNPA